MHEQAEQRNSFGVSCTGFPANVTSGGDATRSRRPGARAALAVHPAERRAQAREQLVDAERLGDVVVRAASSAATFRFVADDRNIMTNTESLRVRGTLRCRACQQHGSRIVGRLHRGSRRARPSSPCDVGCAAQAHLSADLRSSSTTRCAHTATGVRSATGSASTVTAWIVSAQTRAVPRSRGRSRAEPAPRVAAIAAPKRLEDRFAPRRDPRGPGRSRG